MNVNLETPAVENELTVTSQSFDSEGLKVQPPVLADLRAAGCGPCRIIAPLIHELAVEYAGRAKVVKVNVDENPETTTRFGFGVSSPPTWLIFKNGRTVDRIAGPVSKKMPAGRLAAQLN
jgi:thioredoxin 1